MHKIRVDVTQKDTDSNAVSSVSDRTEGTQSTGQAETVVGNSLALVTSLLVPPTGPTDPVLHHGGLTESAISLQ